MPRVSFTNKRIQDFSCPTDKKQAFAWDTAVPQLGIRVTPAGKPAFVFQSRYSGKTVRITIGTPAAWNIGDAQARARELQRSIDAGRDPRIVIAEKSDADHATRIENQKSTVLLCHAWAEYIKERQPYWGEKNYSDHLLMAQKGGQPRKRMPGKLTVAGPLANLMTRPLTELTGDLIEQWTVKENKLRPASARLSLRMLKAFLNWASQDQRYADMVNPLAASSKRIKEAAGKPKAKSDYLQKEQLTTWFEKVKALPNPVVSAYLQILLLTGARREELARLRWEDVNLRWKSLTLNDKVEDHRVIPMTPYVVQLIQALPRRNKWVFSSPSSSTGRLMEPTKSHRNVCKASGLYLTLHGLRRSFKSLSEWLEIPVGVIAQIMGHKPSATAEKHYTVRPLDLLRVHHEKFEVWILRQARVEVSYEVTPLKAVNG